MALFTALLYAALSLGSVATESHKAPYFFGLSTVEINAVNQNGWNFSIVVKDGGVRMMIYSSDLPPSFEQRFERMTGKAPQGLVCRADRIGFLYDRGYPKMADDALIKSGSTFNEADPASKWINQVSQNGRFQLCHMKVIIWHKGDSRATKSVFAIVFPLEPETPVENLAAK